MTPDFNETDYIGKTVIGVDEVGRGPLAGPVIACGASFDNLTKTKFNFLTKLGIKDSKKISAIKRQEILNVLGINIKKIKPETVYEYKYFSFALSSGSPKLIDQINILNASLESMKKSSKLLLNQINKTKLTILIDGNKSFEAFSKNEISKNFKSIILRPIIKGDSKSLVIGLASIIAKEYRDHLMKKLDTKYPEYDFIKNMGYPTARHKALIIKHGVSSVHRKTFKGVKEYL